MSLKAILPLDQLRELTDEDEIFVDTMERLPIYAVELFDGIIFTNNKEYRIAVEDMAEGMALFLKNGKTPQDYLHAFCAALAPNAMV